MTSRASAAGSGGAGETASAATGTRAPKIPGRTGRRPGNPDTRLAILQAARTAFAEVGFSSASVRRIAADAGVDAALVHHYFGSKEKLFLATVQAPVDLQSVISQLSADGVDGLGPRLIRTILSVWESPGGAGMAAVLRSALADPGRARMIREFVRLEIVGRLLEPLRLPADEVGLRTALVMSQVLGVITGRYLLAVEPLASLPADELAAQVGATLQHYFTGRLLAPVQIESVQIESVQIE